MTPLACKLTIERTAHAQFRAIVTTKDDTRHATAPTRKAAWAASLFLLMDMVGWEVRCEL